MIDLKYMKEKTQFLSDGYSHQVYSMADWIEKALPYLKKYRQTMINVAITPDDEIQQLINEVKL
jgi:uncharacterized protein (DUF934 family)